MEKIKNRTVDPAQMERQARIVVSEMALGVQAALMLKYSTNLTAIAFCESRLANTLGFQFGCIQEQNWIDEVIERNKME